MIRAAWVAAGLCLLLTGGACQSGGGSLVLSLVLEGGQPMPAAIEFVAFDRAGMLVRDRISLEAHTPRFPEAELGTLVLHARPEDGPVRVHARAAGVAGVPVQGTLIVNLSAERQVRARLALVAGALSDADGDGVPDAIDDCPFVADPDQIARQSDCRPAPPIADARPPGLPDGSGCAAETDCASGHCVDGVCCDSPCAGGCEACNLPGSLGYCTPVPAGSDPREACPATPASGCGGDGACDGRGQCRLHVAGTICQPAACDEGSGGLQFASTCDGAGHCHAGPQASCAPFLCAGNACRDRCASDADCAVGKSCIDGTCGGKPIGRACMGDGECASGACSDGVCCASRCDGACMACDVEGAVGVCAPIPAGQGSRGRCPVQSPQSCGSDGSCDGAGGCALQVAGTACGVGCQDGAVARLACDGAGICRPGSAAVGCLGYACAQASCLLACGFDAECDTRHTCEGGQCVPRRSEGESCVRASQCTAGHCSGAGLCCPSACEAPGCLVPGAACGAQFGFECTRDGFYVNQCCYETLTDLGPRGDHVGCGARSFAVRAAFDFARSDARYHRGELRRDFAAENLVGKTLRASVYVDGPAVPMNVNLVIITSGTVYKVVKGFNVAPGWNHLVAPVTEPLAQATTGLAVQVYLTQAGTAWAGELHLDEVGWQ